MVERMGAARLLLRKAGGRLVGGQGQRGAEGQAVYTIIPTSFLSQV